MNILNVVAAVIEHEGKILCVRRGPSKYPYIHQKWEFPGGKIEPCEAHTAALLREINEELNIGIHVKTALMTIEHQYADFGLIMDVYLCGLATGTSSNSIILSEHIAFAWLAPSSDDFRVLDWAAADLPAVEALIQATRK
jgi:8-oxo-dGTP diphosphatase